MSPSLKDSSLMSRAAKLYLATAVLTTFGVKTVRHNRLLKRWNRRHGEDGMGCWSGLGPRCMRCGWIVSEDQKPDGHTHGSITKMEFCNVVMHHWRSLSWKKKKKAGSRWRKRNEDGKEKGNGFYCEREGAREWERERLKEGERESERARENERERVS